MKQFLVVALILIYVFVSAFLESGPVGRVTYADLILVGIIGVAALSISHRNTISFPHIYSAALPMFFMFLTSAIFAKYPSRAGFELIVILFSFIGAISITNLLLVMPQIWVGRLVKGYAITIGFVSLLCLIDFFAVPGLVSSRQLGGLQGPFRNTGQAGSFFGVHAALVLALMLAKLIPRSLSYLTSLVLVLLALIFTLKRASILAVIAGILFLALFLAFSRSARDKRIGIIVLSATTMMGLLGYILFDWVLDLVPGLRWRFEYKFSSETIEVFSTGFLSENIASTLSAMSDRPLIGVGLDNVRGIYQSHEIHSTYLGLIAYSGVVGFSTYLFFMMTLMRSMLLEARYHAQNAWAAFVYYLMPLFLGQLIGWGYTIHIRKREFWILVFLIAIAIAISKRMRMRKNADFGQLPLKSEGPQ